jgi:hypothetical protein
LFVGLKPSTEIKSAGQKASIQTTVVVVVVVVVLLPVFIPVVHPLLLLWTKIPGQEGVTRLQ